MRNRPWKSLMKSVKKKKKLSTSKIANKTTAYMKVFLIMRAHGVSCALCPSKVYSLLLATAFHTYTEMNFHKCSPTLFFTERICLVNHNNLVLSTSSDAKFFVLIWKGEIINLTEISINLRKKKFHGKYTIINKRG